MSMSVTSERRRNFLRHSQCPPREIGVQGEIQALIELKFSRCIAVPQTLRLLAAVIFAVDQSQGQPTND